MAWKLCLSNPGKYGTQVYRLFERLQCGEVTNVEIVTKLRIFNYRDKICGLRRGLRLQGFDIKATAMNRDGLWSYRIAELNDNSLL